MAQFFKRFADFLTQHWLQHQHGMVVPSTCAVQQSLLLPLLAEDALMYVLIAAHDIKLEAKNMTPNNILIIYGIRPYP